MSLGPSQTVEATSGLVAATAGASPVILDGLAAGRLVVPGGILGAGFERLGPDLLIHGGGGDETVARDYFAGIDRPDLWSTSGQVFRGSLVERLAGPLAPGQVAQTEAADGTPIGRVTAVEGEAAATHVDGTRSALAVDSPVYQGDVLETGGGASMNVVFVDETSFALGENARMVIDELVYDPSSGQGSAAFSMVEGLFVFVSGEVASSGPDAMTLSTPVATIGIRGTGLAIQAAAKGLRNLISLLVDPEGKLGKVVVSNDGGTMVLDEANETTAVTSFDQGPSITFLLSPQQITSLFGSALGLSPFLGVVPEKGGDTQGDETEEGADGDTPNGDDGQVIKIVLADEAGNLPSTFDVAFTSDLLLLDNPLLDILNVLYTPAIAAPLIAESPTPPQPITATVLPTSIRAGLGTEGDDVIDATALGCGKQGNLLAGFGGNDTIIGGNLDDFMFGGAGNDRLVGGNLDDFMFGGAGNDRLVGGTGLGNNILIGGDGIDTVTYKSTTNGVSANLGTEFFGGAEIGTDTIESVENLIGGEGNDTLIGDGADNSLYGGGGDDFLTGGAGNDELDGGDGIDTVNFSTLTNGVGVGVDLGAGHATGDGEDILKDIENVFGSNFDDSMIGSAGDNRLDGGSGNDSIDGADGIDRLIGGFGNDELFGGAGGDILEGGSGDDAINGGSGDDTLDFGDVTISARITLNLATNTATGDFGNDVISGVENVDASNLFDVLSITGDINRNTLTGGFASDSIFGGGGDDTLIGNDGNDILDGGAGNDNLNGGFGSDTATYANNGNRIVANLANGQVTGGSTDTLTSIENITGSDFADAIAGDGQGNSVLGGNGNDVINGAGGDDFIRGQGDDDVIQGDGGGDVLHGDTGNDDIFGDLGDDLVLGEDGNDTLGGGNGADRLGDGNDVDKLNGGAGNDELEVSADGADGDTFNGGADTDTLDLGQASGATTVDLSVVVAQNLGGGFGTDVVLNIENIQGSAQIDILTGNAAANILDGGPGDDTLTGGPGDDTLFGGAGNNQLNGDASDVADYSDSDVGIHVNFDTNSDNVVIHGAFSDNLSGILTVSGSEFNDTFTGTGGEGEVETFIGLGGNDTVFGSLGDDTYVGGAGVDLLDFSGANLPTPVIIDLRGTATGAFGNDVFSGFENATGGSESDIITGDAGNNLLNGGAGNGEGNENTLTGLGGNDHLIGAEANDLINGGADNDEIEGGDGDDMLIGGGGIDTLSYAGAAGNVTVDLSLKRATGAAGNDTLTNDFENIFGSTHNDSLKGNALDNVIDGGVGAKSDVIFGEGGDDHLIGSDGNGNSLDGGAGNDLLEGGAGSETLDGGADDDQLFGGAGNDNLVGDTGNDDLFGGNNDDVLDGGNDDDVLDGGLGDDSIDGGAGIDTAEFFSGGAVTVNLATSIATGQGVDTLTGIENVIGSTAGDTIIGDAAANNLSGNFGNDVINGGGGADIVDGSFDNDTLNGQGGNDTVIGGFGANVLIGGGGDDLLDGTFGFSDTADYSGGPAVTVNLLTGIATGNGNDTLVFIENVFGSANDDVISGDDNIFSGNSLNGGAGDDELSGLGGNDVLVGGIGADVLDGGAGFDKLQGGDNADHLIGGTEADLLRGDNGNDILEGGDGNDNIFGDPGNDVIDGGTGLFDFLTYITGATSGITVDLSLAGQQVIGGGFGSDTISGIERVQGTGFGDQVIGDGADNSLDGQNGDDVLSGAAGNDNLNGGAGNDVLNGGDGDDLLVDAGGNNLLDGGAGNDQFLAQVPIGAITVIGGDGSDRFSFGGVGSPIVIDLGSAGPQAIAGGTVTLSGIENFRGNVADDTITGDAGRNELDGISGNDILNGGGGDDVLTGGFGNDQLNGGAGLDVADYSSTGSRVIIDLNNAGGIQSGTGNLGVDTFTSIEGVIGGSKLDVLIGDGNDNFLEGRQGIDMLAGGLGADRFAYDDDTHGAVVNTDVARAVANGTGVFGDIIFDFQSGVDRFLVHGANFGGLADGALDPANFRTIAAAYNGLNSGVAAGKPIFIFSQEDNTLYYDDDTSVAGYSVIADLVAGTVTATDIEVLNFV
ncbi:MAG: hypothetical protein EXQ94_05335 [Alphaproteobacteria bacterium]|nr:hypothetical protein [Alphaproteobacteria bacterium]